MLRTGQNTVKEFQQDREHFPKKRNCPGLAIHTGDRTHVGNVCMPIKRHHDTPIYRFSRLSNVYDIFLY